MCKNTLSLRTVWAAAMLVCVATIVAVACTQPDSTQTPSAESAMDRATLVSFYEAMNGTGWHDNRNWLTDEPLWEWHGIATDLNGQVTGLDLHDNNLSEEIPPELGNLSALQILNLSENQLSGDMPSDLAGLSSLEELNLSDNQLSGETTWLTELSNLKVCGSGNPLTGRVLRNWRFTLPSSLDFGGSHDRELPPELGNLSNLKSLSLGFTQLTGQIPPELGKLSNLERLVLVSNQLAGEITGELGKLSNLTYLDISDNNLSGQIPLELGNLSNLEYLFMAGTNRFTGCIPKGLRYIKTRQYKIRGDAGFGRDLQQGSNLDTDSYVMAGDFPIDQVTLFDTYQIITDLDRIDLPYCAN